METTKVRIWKLTRRDTGTWLAVEANGLDAIADELQGAEVGDVFDITVEEWDRADVEALPEFDGF